MGLARELVHSDGALRLYRYGALSGEPLLVVYALVNRPDILDLDRHRSLLRGLTARGLTVYLIDWGYPTAAECDTGLAEYLARIDACAKLIARAHGRRRIDVLGICQGGVLSLCYTALHATRVRRLVTMVTPVDFHTSRDLLSKWARALDVAQLTRAGNVPGALLNRVFLALQPFRLGQHKYVRLLDGRPTRAQWTAFLRTERWLHDSPDQAARAFREFVEGCYQRNGLVRGTLRIGRERVSLRRITQPLLNVIAQRDHVVPPEASRALAGRTASRAYQEVAFDVGHIGIFVSARAQRAVPEAIAGWLAAAPARRAANTTYTRRRSH